MSPPVSPAVMVRRRDGRVSVAWPRRRQHRDEAPRRDAAGAIAVDPAAIQSGLLPYQWGHAVCAYIAGPAGMVIEVIPRCCEPRPPRAA